MEILEAKKLLTKGAKILSNNKLISTFCGSISMKFENSSFFVNKQDIFFTLPNNDDFILLEGKKDYRWKEACEHALIYQNIFKSITGARVACVCMPTFLSAYGLEHASFEPKDILGQEFGNIFIYDTKDADDWLERAPSEIVRHFSSTGSNIILLKGAGVCAYERTFRELARKLIILENSAKLLTIAKKL